VAKREKIAWDEVCSKAAKVVSFIDLAGHERSVQVVAGCCFGWWIL
jgi:GTPase